MEIVITCQTTSAQNSIYQVIQPKLHFYTVIFLDLSNLKELIRMYIYSNEERNKSIDY